MKWLVAGRSMGLSILTLAVASCSRPEGLGGVGVSLSTSAQSRSEVAPPSPQCTPDLQLTVSHSGIKFNLAVGAESVQKTPDGRIIVSAESAGSALSLTWPYAEKEAVLSLGSGQQARLTSTVVEPTQVRFDGDLEHSSRYQQYGRVWGRLELCEPIPRGQLANVEPGHAVYDRVSDVAAAVFNSVRDASCGQSVGKRAREVIRALETADLTTLARFVHPERGLRFQGGAPIPSSQLTAMLHPGAQSDVAKRDRKASDETLAEAVREFRGIGPPFTALSDRERRASFGWRCNAATDDVSLTDDFQMLHEYRSPAFSYAWFDARQDDSTNGPRWQRVLVFENWRGEPYVVAIFHTEWSP